MNIPYLQQEIIPQRAKEIKAGQNAGTRQPIYVVMDLNFSFISGHDDEEWISDFLLNYKRKSAEFGYIDTSKEIEDRTFLETACSDACEKVTKIYTDKIIAFFLTRKGAEEYLEYQKHNLTEAAYIYTFYSGYANREMDRLLDNN